MLESLDPRFRGDERKTDSTISEFALAGIQIAPGCELIDAAFLVMYDDNHAL
jgi:hypothetical protein